MNASDAMSAGASSTEPRIDTITDILIGTILGIDYLILFPIFVQCVRVLYKNRKIQVFRSRRPVTLQYILGITFIVFALIQPYRLFDGSIPNNRYKIPFYIPSWISISMEYSITLALLLCYVQRAYLIHYDFNYHEAILNSEWKQFTSSHQKELEWFLKHRNNFGNRTFTLFIIIIIWVLLSAILTGLSYHFDIETHWIIIQLVLFVLVEISTLKLILSMPGLDVFRIRDEYMYLLGVGFAMIAIIVSLLMFYDAQNIFQVIISRIIYHSTTMIGTVAMLAISVIYPYRVHHAIQEDCNNKERSSKRNIKNIKLSPQTVPQLSPNTSPRMSPKASPKLSPRNRVKSITEMLESANTAPSLARQRSHDNNRVSLDELMRYLVGIEAFLDHLVKELSAENLFFLSDVMQYKNAFVSEGILDEVFGWSMLLPDDIPRSCIILEEPDHYLRSKKICDKYIRTNSEREINISWGARTQIVNAYDQMDTITKPKPITYSTRFDFAAEEIRKLLADSFRRFCLTPEYKKFCRDYNTRARRFQRKISKSFRSVTRELSRDRSHSRDQHYDPHSPHAHPLTRLKTYSSKGERKLADINEYSSPFGRSTIRESKEEDDMVLPLSLSKLPNITPLKTMALGIPIDRAMTPIEISKSYSSSHSNEEDKKQYIYSDTCTITERKQPNMNMLPSKSEHLEVRIPAGADEYNSSESSNKTTDTSNMNKNDILKVLMTPTPIQTMAADPTITPYPRDEENTPATHAINTTPAITPAMTNITDDSVANKADGVSDAESVDSQQSTAM